MTRPLALASAVLLAACAAPTDVWPPAQTYEALDGVTVPDSVSVAEVAGPYVRHGYHGYRALDLRTDGSLAYHVFEAGRVDTTVAGRWDVAGGADGEPPRIALDVPRVLTAYGFAYEGEHSLVLDVVRVGRRLVLVPRDAKPLFLEYGPFVAGGFRPETVRHH